MSEITTILSLAVTGLSVLGTIASNILTPIIANRHALKLIAMDDEKELRREIILHQRKILEDYAQAVGQVVTSIDANTMQEYGKCHALALLYVPDGLHQEMMNLDWQVLKQDTLSMQNLANSIVPQIKAIVQNIHIEPLSINNKNKKIKTKCNKSTHI